MKIYCCGIGGIGLSAYACLQKAGGHDVSGSDRTSTALTDDLQKQGIEVSFTQDGSAIENTTDLFVYSEAIPASAPERKKAAELGIRELSYPQALGEYAASFKVIAVAGTHGKSSTTAMAARLLMESDMDPTVVVGTKMRELNGRNWRTGKGTWMIIEACEYRRSFLAYTPQILLLTNADGDHFDYYTSTDDYQAAYTELIARMPADGIVITHGSDPDCAKIIAESKRQMMDADTQPLIELNTPGLHMRQNAQLVLALASTLGIPPDQAVNAIAGYAGSWRRMEVKGNYREDITIIDDYAHHPREIRATLQALREQYKDRRIVCVFQPHTHNRTLALYDDFIGSFADANVVIISNMYDARHDTEKGEVDVPRFVGDIHAASHVEAIDGHSLAETEQLLRGDMLKPNDVLICMGAGDITNLADRMSV